MKQKILSLILLSFFIIKAYSQSSISKETRGERGSRKDFTSFDMHDQPASGISADSGICGTPTGLEVSNIFGTEATVSWEAAAGATKYHVRYKESTSSSWTIIHRIYSTSCILTGLTPRTSYEFKVRSLCVQDSLSALSTIARFKTGIYCPSVGNTHYEYINSVKLGAIDNTSSDNAGYGDYTSLSAALAAGGTKKIKLTPGFNFGPYDEYWEVYIDYNRDGSFGGADEKVGQGHGKDTVKIHFTVPLTALNGKTVMRVVMRFSSYLNNPCPGHIYDGETEDYTVRINSDSLHAIAAENDVKATFNSIMVSPNPVRGGSANLILQAGKAGPVNIKIADLSGRVLRSENIISIAAGKNDYSLRNINLLPGTYMVVAQQGSSIIARTQFVVDK